MWNEDNEAVETVSADAAPEGGSEAEVETSASEPMDVAADTTEDVTPVEVEEEPEVEVPEVFDWNGEFESLRSAGWLRGLDEDKRDAILKGVEEKYQNWQRGYTGKYQELAKQRREAEEMLKEVRDQEIRVQRWLNGDINPMVEKQREIDELKIAHKATLRALRREAEEAHEKAVRTHGQSMEQAAKERDEALKRYAEVQQQMEQFENQQTESQVDALEKWLISEHNDIYENDTAFDEFCELARANIPPERAIQMLRCIYPKEVEATEPEPAPEPEPEPEPVPDGMKLMNMGPDTAAATEGGDPRSFEEIMDGLRKTAMIEQELVLRN